MEKETLKEVLKSYGKAALPTIMLMAALYLLSVLTLSL